MKSIMLSIKPKYCELIASGKKTMEIRKTVPKLKPPFKCYIYCTQPHNYQERLWILNDRERRHTKPIAKMFGANEVGGAFLGNGKVIAEFTCDTFITDKTFGHDALLLGAACLTPSEAAAYCTKQTYGWHISELVIYNKPKELSEFKKINRDCWYADLGLAKRDCPECRNVECFLTRPPQSWCYVEEII